MHSEALDLKSDIFDSMEEHDRLLYLSCTEVVKSTFWKYLLRELDGQMHQANGEMLTKTMKGDTNAALIAACKIQAYDWLLKTVEEIKETVLEETLNQSQEEY